MSSEQLRAKTLFGKLEFSGELPQALVKRLGTES